MLPDLEKGTVTAEENDKKVLVNIQPQGLLFLIGTIMYTYRDSKKICEPCEPCIMAQ